MRFFCATRSDLTNSPIKKEICKGIKDLLKNFPTLLFIFILMKLREFIVTKNKTPKMVEISASTNRLSRNFSEHVTHDLVGILINISIGAKK